MRTNFLFLLKPFSILWEYVYRLRRLCFEYGIFKRNIYHVPVVSVGNLTFGGSGKTPFIIYLVQFFEKRNLTPVVLTRGYKGELEYGSGIIRGGQRFKSNPLEYGDEPLMIAKYMSKGAVIVGSNRSRNLEKYFDQVRPDIVLLDDGFQHLKIFRNANIVLFDSTINQSSLKVAPQGYLREGLTALKDADLVVFNKADLVAKDHFEKLERTIAHHLPPSVPHFKIRYVPMGLYNWRDQQVMQIDELQDLDVLAMAGVASPKGFLKMLEDFGARIVESKIFGDHHSFTKEDLNEVLVASSRHSAIIIATEKDMVKLRRLIQDDSILYLKINIEFLDSEFDFQSKLVKSLSLDSSGFIDLE